MMRSILDGQMVCDCGCETMIIYIRIEPDATVLSLQCTRCETTMDFTGKRPGDEPVIEDAVQ